MENSIRIVQKQCVNSTWIAHWLAKDNQEFCECIVSCKIKVDVAQNGHPPYRYVVTEKEYKQLNKKINEGKGKRQGQ